MFLFYNISSKYTQKKVLSLKGFTHNEKNVSQVDNEQSFVSGLKVYEKEKIFVEIKGEVFNPDVYELDEGSRVKDLISISGGITEKGDISNINQARELVDGECIVVMSKEEILNVNGNLNESFNSNSLSKESGQDNLININTATKEELKTLNGIGDSIADSIIKYRQENGKFKNIEEIKNVSRIGDKIFEKIMDSIRVW